VEKEGVNSHDRRGPKKVGVAVLGKIYWRQFLNRQCSFVGSRQDKVEGGIGGDFRNRDWYLSKIQESMDCMGQGL